MKHEFRLTRPAFIGKKELSAGELVATVEVPEGLPLDRVVNAIVSGHATQAAPSAPSAPAPAAQPVKAKK